MNQCFLLLILLFSLPAAVHSSTLEFTKTEQAWIDKKIPVTYVYDVDWAPFEWKNEVNRHTGIVSDILKLIAFKSKLKFVPIHTSSWDKAVLLAKNKKVDMYSAIPFSVERANYMHFTTQDIFQYNACFVKRMDDATSYKNLLTDIDSKRIAIVKSSSLGSQIMKKYPTASYIELEKTEEGFKQLQEGKIDLFVINSATADYMINVKGYHNLKIARKLEDVFKLKIALSKKMPKEILHIIDKTLATIDQDEIDLIYHKWTRPHYETAGINWKVVSYIAVLVIIVFLFLFYRQYLLYQSNKNLEQIVRERTKDLELSERKLRDINENLEQRIQEEIEKNRIQDQKMLKQSKLALMGEMISMIAHQWRQPLNIITLNIARWETASLLKAKPLDEETKAMVEQINKQSQYLSQTIDDFRNFYKPDKDSVNIELKDLVAHALSLIGPSLSGLRIKIIEQHKDQEKIMVYDNEMIQVLLNILKNAQDNFKSKGIKEPWIEIMTGDRVISICDNGGGISEDIIEKVFDPYFSTKNEKSVTGLGLYMSKVIVEKHHQGFLEVKNVGDGACFTITL